MVAPSPWPNRGEQPCGHLMVDHPGHDYKITHIGVQNLFLQTSHDEKMKLKPIVFPEKVKLCFQVTRMKNAHPLSFRPRDFISILTFYIRNDTFNESWT
jgi:hypothetical protein